MREFLFITSIVVIVCLLTVLPIITIALYMDSLACSQAWDPKETDYSVIAGCRVKINGEFVPDRSVRNILD